MKFLLTFVSTTLFCLFLGIRNKNLKNSIYIAIFGIFSPIFIFNNFEINILYIYLLFLIFLCLTEIIKSKLFRNLFLTLLTIIVTIFITFQSGAITNNFQTNIPVSEIFFDILTRFFYHLSINKLITYFGFTFFYLIYLSLLKKKNYQYLIMPLVITLINILEYKTFSQIVYLFSLPLFLTFFIKSISKLNQYLLILTIAFGNIIYLL